MRKGARIVYNQSQDVFYCIWECYHCHNIIYYEVEPKDMPNAEYQKRLALWSQRWNEKADKYNRELLKNR